VVVRLFPQEGYGFLQAPDGREIYFHEKSVLKGAFGRLKVGDEVRYAEELGEEGPQASTVAVARRERRAG
jgi:cold shock CspA family protein